MAGLVARALFDLEVVAATSSHESSSRNRPARDFCTHLVEINEFPARGTVLFARRRETCRKLWAQRDIHHELDGCAREGDSVSACRSASVTPDVASVTVTLVLLATM